MRSALRFLFLSLLIISHLPAASAQAALLLEEPYGVFGTVNPTGHTALYFARICAESPTRLRLCQPGESGVVISRYQGIANYDWLAIPLEPYLYATEHANQAPSHVTPAQVHQLRSRYREAHLLMETAGLDEGGFLHGGWGELIGVSYERRIWAFRFTTTPEQDQQLIRTLNARPNSSHFSLLMNNCSDFARSILNLYFPGKFRRTLIPDAAITTPKQVAYRLVKRARKEPAMELQVFELPQIPGYRKHSHANKNISESFVTSTGYALPLSVINPMLLGGLGVDYLVASRHHLLPRNPQILGAMALSALYLPGTSTQEHSAADDSDFTLGPGDISRPRALR